MRRLWYVPSLLGHLCSRLCEGLAWVLARMHRHAIFAYGYSTLRSRGQSHAQAMEVHRVARRCADVMTSVHDAVSAKFLSIGADNEPATDPEIDLSRLGGWTGKDRGQA